MATADLYGFLGPEDRLKTSYGQAGSGLDSGSIQSQTIQQPPSSTTGMAQGAIPAMNAGASPGGVLTSAGLYGVMAGTGGTAAPVALGAGVALSAYEQQKKAEAMTEQARVEEAQNRKAAVQNALTQALGATRQLGV